MVFDPLTQECRDATGSGRLCPFHFAERRRTVPIFSLLGRPPPAPFLHGGISCDLPALCAKALRGECNLWMFDSMYGRSLQGELWTWTWKGT